MTTDTNTSTNGHIPVKHESTPDGEAAVVTERTRSARRRLVMPVLLAATAVIILRRMQRGSVV